METLLNSAVIYVLLAMAVIGMVGISFSMSEERNRKEEDRWRDDDSRF